MRNYVIFSFPFEIKLGVGVGVGVVVGVMVGVAIESLFAVLWLIELLMEAGFVRCNRCLDALVRSCFGAVLRLS